MTMTTMHCNGLPDHRGDDDDDGNDGHPDHDHVFKDAFASLPAAQRWRANNSTTSLSRRRPGCKRYGQFHIVSVYFDDHTDDHDHDQTLLSLVEDLGGRTIGQLHNAH